MNGYHTNTRVKFFNCAAVSAVGLVMTVANDKITLLQ